MDPRAAGFIHDVYARVGGPDPTSVRTTTCVHIYSDNVVGDNMWLWRADHAQGAIVDDKYNPSNHGMSPK